MRNRVRSNKAKGFRKSCAPKKAFGRNGIVAGFTLAATCFVVRELTSLQYVEIFSECVAHAFFPVCWFLALRPRKLPETSDSRRTSTAEPIKQGTRDTPARSGPKWPMKLPPIQAPMIPTIADVRNPPGRQLGIRRSAKKAQIEATIMKRMKLRIPIIRLQLIGGDSRSS